MLYVSQNRCRESRKLLTNSQNPLAFLVDSILRLIFTKFHPRPKNHGKYSNGCYNSMIHNQDGHIPLPLITFSCTALRHALLEWQMINGVHLKASKSKLKADRPDRLDYFNYHTSAGKNASFCAAMCRMLITSPGIADLYTCLMNPWITLPQSYKDRVYKNIVLQSSARSNR